LFVCVVRHPTGAAQWGSISANARLNANPKVDEAHHRVSQARFAQLLGVSVRTLQDWEQRRRAPSRAARTLLMIAAKNPQALLDVA
jgi:putative transcriptional regulator